MSQSCKETRLVPRFQDFLSKAKLEYRAQLAPVGLFEDQSTVMELRFAPTQVLLQDTEADFPCKSTSFGYFRC